MRPILLLILTLLSSHVAAQQQEMEIGTDPFLFREMKRSFTYELHEQKTAKPKIEGDTSGLFLSLFENLSSAPLLRITRPGPLKGYPTIFSVEESDGDHYILVRKMIRVPCSSDPLDTAYFLVEKRNHLDPLLMDHLFELARLAIKKDGQPKQNISEQPDLTNRFYITVREDSGTYLTGEIFREPTAVRNDRLNHFISLSDDFLWYTDDFNPRRYSSYLNDIRFLKREYETGIKSPLRFH